RDTEVHLIPQVTDHGVRGFHALVQDVTQRTRSARQLRALLAAVDDTGPGDLDPRLEFDIPAAGVYVVKVVLSPKQSAPPPVEVPYTIFHSSLRPDEISIPLVIRGPYMSTTTIRGIKVQLEFDPNVLVFTGLDLERGFRISSRDRTLSSAQEAAGEIVLGVAGRVKIAVRAFTGSGFNTLNGLGGTSSSAFDSSEIVFARARFRGISAGSTEIRFVPNSSTSGQPLSNLLIVGDASRAGVSQPMNGYGPNIRVTVTGN
ncbi:MAG: hypothetical protein ACE5IK_01685, partial [Acidobacteriota bacterium]